VKSAKLDVTLHVRGCSDCPLRYDGISCNHPQADGWVDETDGPEPHEFCPLRKGELTLRLRERKT
jgi:hypothetical protein